MPLELKLAPIELWNEKTEELTWLPSITLVLEHSLLSVSKWEQKWKIPFLDKEEKTNEQILDYIRCMNISNKKVSDLYFNNLSIKDIKKVYDYINDAATATWFNEKNLPRGRNGETATSELIYYWLTCFNIPFEVEKWHLNRLLTLVQICNIKQQKPTKMSKRDILKQNHALNQARKAKRDAKK
jgi:hypothetical protein